MSSGIVFGGIVILCCLMVGLSVVVERGVLVGEVCVFRFYWLILMFGCCYGDRSSIVVGRGCPVVVGVWLWYDSYVR